LFKKNVIVQGLSVSYYQKGASDNGACVVFLHGWGSQALHFAETLKKCDNFIAIDLPGFGSSEAPEKAWGILDYAIFLDNFLKKINLGNLILVGHSFGGSVIIKYGSLNKKVKKIILISSAGTRRKSLRTVLCGVFAKIFKVFFNLPGLGVLKNKARRKLYKAIGSEDYINSRELKETYKKIIKEDLKEDLKRIKAETILIWGDKDKETPIKDGLIMNKLIKKSKMFAIKNAGHYVFLDKKKEFNKIFLEQIK